MTATYLALEALFTRYLNLVKAEHNHLPSVQFDPPWPSPCALPQEKNCEDNTVYWKPSPRKESNIFNDLEKALEISFRPEFVEYYASFWSNGICVERDDINLSLIQIWNEEDQEKLKENILGHTFAKLKSKQALSYFIGCTHSDDVICIDHETGEITLEKPGRKAHKVLAPSLETFLLSLNPTLDNYDG